MLTRNDIDSIGFKSVGNNVFISQWATFYNAKNISIGDNVRIDDFCVLSAGEGGIEIGSNIHIGTHCSLIGKALIRIEDYSGLSSGTRIFSSTDDFGGEYYCNAVMPESMRNVYSAPVVLKQFVNLGANCTILPGVTMEENCAVGSNSFVKKSLPANGIYAGAPAKVIAVRKNNKYV